MAPASNEAQFKFLISCIRYSNNGKVQSELTLVVELNTDAKQVDFGEVARECGIVTKGAAAKRYERMMKAHGIHPTSPSTSETPTPVKPKDTAKLNAMKKRKLDQFSDGPNGLTDDDEGLARIKDEMEPVRIKDEEATAGTGYHPAEELQYPTLQADCSVGGGNSSYRSDDASVFNDFMQSGTFSQTFAETQPSFPVESSSSVYGDLMTGAPEEAPQTANEIILITD